MEYSVHNNQENQQFEIHLQEELASMTYRVHEGQIFLMLTTVPKKLKGKGVGGCLVEHALKFAKDHELEIVAYCSFSKRYLERKGLLP